MTTRAKDLATLEAEFAAQPESLVFLDLAEAYLSDKRFVEAMVVAKKGSKAFPDLLGGKLLMCRIYIAQDKASRAEKDITALHASNANSAAVQAVWGLFKNASGDKAEAEAAFKRALDLDPTEPLAATGLKALGVTYQPRAPAPAGPAPKAPAPPAAEETEITEEDVEAEAERTAVVRPADLVRDNRAPKEPPPAAPTPGDTAKGAPRPTPESGKKPSQPEARKVPSSPGAKAEPKAAPEMEALAGDDEDDAPRTQVGAQPPPPAPGMDAEDMEALSAAESTAVGPRPTGTRSAPPVAEAAEAAAKAPKAKRQPAPEATPSAPKPPSAEGRRLVKTVAIMLPVCVLIIGVMKVYRDNVEAKNRLVRLGHHAAELDNYTGLKFAREQLEQVLEKDPDNGIALGELSYVLVQLWGRYGEDPAYQDRAETLVQKITTGKLENVSPWYHAARGLALLYNGKIKEAETALDSSIMNDKAVDMPVLIAMGMAKMAQGDLAVAQAQYLDKVRAKNPSHPMTQLAMAEYFMRKGQPGEAIQAATALVKSYESMKKTILEQFKKREMAPPPDDIFDNSDALAYRAMFHAMAGLPGNLKAAADDLKTFDSRPDTAKSKPARARAAFAQSLIALATGDNTGSEKLLNTAAGLDPKNPLFFQYRARALIKAGDFAGAEEALNKALAIDSGRVELQIMMATTLTELGRYEDARARATKLQEMSDDKSIGLVLAARAYRLEGKWDEAKQNAEKALGLNQSSGAAHAELGYAAEKAGDEKAATEAFTKAARIFALTGENRGAAEIYIVLTRMALKAKKEEDAAKFAQQARQADRLYPDTYYYLGRLFTKAKQTPEAKQAYNDYLTLAPNGSLADKVKEALGKL